MIRYIKETNIAKLNFISLLFIIGLLSLGLGYLFISGYNEEFRQELEKMEKDYLHLRKQKTINSVNLAVQNYEIRSSHIEEELKSRLKKKVLAAHHVASVILKTYQGTKTPTEIKEIIISSLQSMRRNGGEAYYLFQESDDPVIINPDETLFEGLTFIGYEKESPLGLLKRMMRKTKLSDEDFFYFRQTGQLQQKEGTFFLKRFSPLEWYFGKLDYHQTIEDQLREEIITEYANKAVKPPGGNDFEIYELLEAEKGKQSLRVLFHPLTPSLMGQELTTFHQDAKGQHYIEQMIRTIKSEGAGFVEHWVLGSDCPEAKLRMTYYLYYPRWNWIVAQGFEVDNMERLHLQEMMVDLEKKIKTKIKSATGLFVFIVLISLVISIFFSRAIAKIFADYKRKVEDRNTELATKNEMLQKEISERKKMEASLKKSEIQLRRLASEVHLAEERERRSIAADLHDSIGSALAISNMKLEMLFSQIKTPAIVNDLNTVHKHIKEVIQQTRALTFQLSPPALYQMGLEAALAGLAEQTQKLQGIVTVFNDDHQEKHLAEDVRIHIFRSVRELLVNVIKHGKAKHIQMSASRVDDQLQIVVADDGIGFEIDGDCLSPEEGGKFGLFSIRERLKLLGGQLEIRSAIGKGTVVILKAPLKTPSSANQETPS